jgi:hypothetical protein
LAHIFRVGYGLALELKWRTKRWLDTSWPATHGFPLGFWDEYWMGVLGGLLLDKPLFFDNYETGVLYREFSDLHDLRVTGKALDTIIAFDKVLVLLAAPLPAIVPKGTLSFKSLVLTLWARYYLGLTPELLPIDPDRFRQFFKDLWSGRKSQPTPALAMKASFMDWLSEATCLTPKEITGELGEVFDSLFEEIESEYGPVSEMDLDPKYFQLFLLER